MTDNLSQLSNTLLQSAVESTIARIRHDASGIHSVINTVAELRKLNPNNTWCADLRLSARDLRTTALILDQMAERAEVLTVIEDWKEAAE